LPFVSRYPSNSGPEDDYYSFAAAKLWQHGCDETEKNGRNRMARKKRTKRFRAVTAVKELAREQVGAPPAGKVVLEKKRKPEKHKPTLGKLLGEAE
jgi:hypothetical protein